MRRFVAVFGVLSAFVAALRLPPAGPPVTPPRPAPVGAAPPRPATGAGAPAPATAAAPPAAASEAARGAGDAAGVLALLAPDAVVRERWGEVPPAVWDTRDPRVVHAYLEGSHDGEAYDTSGFAWASGHRQIAAWAAARFAQHQRLAAARYRAAGGTVGWQYQEFDDPFQGLPGVGPLEGTAEAEVRGGAITRLTLVQSPASAARQRGEVEAAARAAATRRAAPVGFGAARGGPAPEPTAAAWPLGLGALAALSVVTAALRRRRAPRR
jgi:hypothetical protein